MKHNRYEVALRVGNAVSPELCWSRLAGIGYSSAELVCQPGQMARRGGIIDVFPFQGKQPYRIDWFGDQIDSIRTFDPKTMLSLEKIDSLVVPPKPERPQRTPRPKSPQNGRKVKRAKLETLLAEAESVDEAASKNAIQELICFYRSEGRYWEALNWQLRIYEEGNACHSLMLASIYHEMQEYEHALFWSIRAFHQGDADLAFGIAEYYEQGQGTERNIGEAIKWYRRAATRSSNDYNALLKLKELKADCSDLLGKCNYPGLNPSLRRGDRHSAKRGAPQKRGVGQFPCEGPILVAVIAILTLWLVCRWYNS